LAQIDEYFEFATLNLLGDYPGAEYSQAIILIMNSLNSFLHRTLANGALGFVLKPKNGGSRTPRPTPKTFSAMRQQVGRGLWTRRHSIGF
jgi:hypothetical protein